MIIHQKKQRPYRYKLKKQLRRFLTQDRLQFKKRNKFVVRQTTPRKFFDYLNQKEETPEQGGGTNNKKKFSK